MALQVGRAAGDPVITFDVLGKPITQGSTRAFVANGRAVVTHDKRGPLMDWRNAIANAAQKCGGEKAERGTAVQVRAWFRLERPKSAPKRVVRPTTKPDIDKLGRSLLDALTGILWADDSQVVSLQVIKRFAEPKEALGVYVEVMGVDE